MNLPKDELGLFNNIGSNENELVFVVECCSCSEDAYSCGFIADLLEILEQE